MAAHAKIPKKLLLTNKTAIDMFDSDKHSLFVRKFLAWRREPMFFQQNMHILFVGKYEMVQENIPLTKSHSLSGEWIVKWLTSVSVRLQAAQGTNLLP